MAPDWDQFEAAAGRVADDMDFREVAVWNWDRGPFNDSTGRYGDSSWTRQATIEAEVTEPNKNDVIEDASGIESEADAWIYIPEGTSVDLVSTHSEDRATVIEDQLSDKQYSVREIFFENNGQIRLTATETGIEEIEEATA